MAETKESTPLTETARTSNIGRCKLHGVVEFLNEADENHKRMSRLFVTAFIFVFLGIVFFVFGVLFFSAMNGVWPITAASNCNASIYYSGDIPVGTYTLAGNTTQAPDPGFADRLEIGQTRGQVLMWLQLTAMLVTCLLLLLANNCRCTACLSSLASYISFFCFLIGAVMVVCCVVWPVSLEAARCVTVAGFFLGLVGFVSSALFFLSTALGITCNFPHLPYMSSSSPDSCCYLGSSGDGYQHL